MKLLLVYVMTTLSGILSAISVKDTGVTKVYNELLDWTLFVSAIIIVNFWRDKDSGLHSILGIPLVWIVVFLIFSLAF
jgi:hypothetical protein